MVRVALVGVVLGGAVLLGWPAPRAPAATTWRALLAPLTAGAEVTPGYVLSEPRLEPSGHIVLVARRPAELTGGRDAASVEIHVVPRGEWAGIRETRSFGVAYEVPRSHAPRADCEAVAEAVAVAIRASDTGLARPDAIPLDRAVDELLVTRVIARVEGVRGALLVTCLAVALLLVGTLRAGALWAALSLFVLGLAVRLPALGLPFVRDQDVQRVFTSQRPLWEIFTGAALEDRHPPLYFALLHVLSAGDTSEQVMRLPAAISGALVAPALVAATRALRGRSLACASLAALGCAISPLAVAQSREVSELPLFAVACVLLAGCLSRALERPVRVASGAVGALHAIALWLYYLAPFVAVGAWIGVAASRRAGGRVPWRAALAGTLVGAPALVVGAGVFLADRGARGAAERFPTIAWGSRSPLEMIGLVTAQVLDGFGAPLIVAVLLAAAVAATRRRDAAVLVPLTAFVTALVAMIALTPFARLQPYYVGGLVPLVFLAAALAPAPAPAPARAGAGALVRDAFLERTAIAAALAVGLAALGATRIAPSRETYSPDPRAFGPRFARAILARPEGTVVCVAHYDATTLAYYLGAETGERVDWRYGSAARGWRLGGKTLEPLVFAHQLTDASPVRLRDATRAALDRGPLLVVVRDTETLPAVAAELARCATLSTTPDARLLSCSP